MGNFYDNLNISGNLSINNSSTCVGTSPLNVPGILMIKQ